MIPSLKIDMADAANERSAYVALIEKAVKSILDFEQHHGTAAESNETMDQAVDQLMGGLSKVRVVDIAPPVKEFIRTTVSNNLKIDVLMALENKVDSYTSGINDAVIEHLALGSIYEEEDAYKAIEQNALAYFYLGQGQNNKIGAIVGTLEHIGAHNFGFSAQQKADIQQILIAKTKDVLTADKKDPEIAGRLIKLVQEIGASEAIAHLLEPVPQTATPTAPGSLDLK